MISEYVVVILGPALPCISISCLVVVSDGFIIEIILRSLGDGALLPFPQGGDGRIFIHPRWNF